LCAKKELTNARFVGNVRKENRFWTREDLSGLIGNSVSFNRSEK